MNASPVHYRDNEMLKEAVWRDRQKISILVELTVCQKKCRKCIELSRDYIEKQSVVCNISILVYSRVAKLFERPL